MNEFKWKYNKEGSYDLETTKDGYNASVKRGNIAWSGTVTYPDKTEGFLTGLMYFEDNARNGCQNAILADRWRKDNE